MYKNDLLIALPPEVVCGNCTAPAYLLVNIRDTTPSLRVVCMRGSCCNNESNNYDTHHPYRFKVDNNQ